MCLGFWSGWVKKKHLPTFGRLQYLSHGKWSISIHFGRRPALWRRRTPRPQRPGTTSWWFGLPGGCWRWLVSKGDVWPNKSLPAQWCVGFEDADADNQALYSLILEGGYVIISIAGLECCVFYPDTCFKYVHMFQNLIQHGPRRPNICPVWAQFGLNLVWRCAFHTQASCLQ